MKKCPICETKEWSYDVLLRNGMIFCGDCYYEVKKYARQHNLMKAFVFVSQDALQIAIKKVKHERIRREGGDHDKSRS